MSFFSTMWFGIATLARLTRCLTFSQIECSQECDSLGTDSPDRMSDVVVSVYARSKSRRVDTKESEGEINRNRSSAFVRRSSQVYETHSSPRIQSEPFITKDRRGVRTHTQAYIYIYWNVTYLNHPSVYTRTLVEHGRFPCRHDNGHQRLVCENRRPIRVVGHTVIYAGSTRRARG